MHKVDTYRPEVIDFTVETTEVPATLGVFKTDDDARLFMASNLLAVQSKLTTNRFMDQVELEGLRDQYADELENNLPTYEEEHLQKHRELEVAKQNEKDAREMVNASINKVKQLVREINERIVEINLDPATTWECVYGGKRFYYTYMDKEIKLAAVRDIASYEKDDLISTSEKNAQFFEGLKKTANG